MKTATVIKCEGELALLKTIPDSTPCNTCKSPCSAGQCASVKPIELWAKNSIGAESGSVVEATELKSSAPTVSALCCLVLPLVLAVLSFVLAIGYIEEVFAFLVSLFVFAVIEILAIPVAKIYEKYHPTLNIVKNLENK